MRTRMILTAAMAGAILAAPAVAPAGDFAFQINLGIGRPQPVVVSSPVMTPAPVYVPAPTLGIAALWNNEPLAAMAGGYGSAAYFRIDVPAGQTYLNVLTSGGVGDCDLYLARGYLPTPDRYDYTAQTEGTEEQISVLYPESGPWYAMVYAFSGYSDVGLLGSFWRQQEVYCPTVTCVGLCRCHIAAANVQVDIRWDSCGYRREHGGLLPFIVGHLRSRPVVHHVDYPHRPVVVTRGPAVVVRRPVVAPPPLVVHRPPVVLRDGPAGARDPRPAVMDRAGTWAPQGRAAEQPAIRERAPQAIERPGRRELTPPVRMADPPTIRREPVAPQRPQVVRTEPQAPVAAPARPVLPARTAPQARPEPPVRTAPVAAPVPREQPAGKSATGTALARATPIPAPTAAPASAAPRGGKMVTSEPVRRTAAAGTDRRELVASLRERTNGREK